MAHIELGHSMITLVEPHRDKVQEYNRWYEHDHAYAAVTSAAGCFAYNRYVATRPLKDLRYPDPSAVADPVDNGSYVAIYWYEKGRIDEVNGHMGKTGPELAAAGRMNADRDHVSTAVYDYVGGTGRGQSPVPPEIALDHPYPGLVLVWIRPEDGVDVRELATWAEDELDGELRAGRGPVGQVVDLVQSDAGFALTGRVEELVRCYFVDADPREVWDDVFAGLGKAVEAGGKGRVELAAPFIPTVPGTTRYQDELW